MNGYQRIQRDRDRDRQPIICRGCPWGTWTGTKQTCLWLECKKKQPKNFMQWHRMMADTKAGFDRLSIDERYSLYLAWRDQR